MNIYINSPSHYTQEFGVINEIYEMSLVISKNIDVSKYTDCLDSIGITPMIAPKDVLNKKGCIVSFLGYKCIYNWDDLKIKNVEYYDNSVEYRTPYYGGVVFSSKEVKKPKWVKAATFSIFVHPLSVFFIYFEPTRPTFYYKYPQIYEIDEAIFRNNMKEWEVEIKGL